MELCNFSIVVARKLDVVCTYQARQKSGPVLHYTMSPEQDDPKPLVFAFPGQDYDDEFCRRILEKLADGSITPSQAAADLDAWVVGESSRRLAELRSQPESIEKDDEGRVHRRCTPNASGYVEHFFQIFSSLCSVFPPCHPGQTRIIEFLQALMAMPEHQAPDNFADSRNLDEVTTIALWKNTNYATEWLRIGADGS